MPSLIDDLQTPKSTLLEFKELAGRVLEYVPNVISNTVSVRGYKIHSFSAAGTTKFSRPLNERRFVTEVDEFRLKFEMFLGVLEALKTGIRDFEDSDYELVDNVVYTIQQSIGIGLDFLGESNSSRKHVGNRFEELIRLIISAIGVANKKMVFTIPFPYGGDGKKNYSCETDAVLSSADRVQSTPTSIEPGEIVLSLKTSSKDRMGKIFLDKTLMEKFARHPVKVVGIFLNDVQRKAKANISFTFVSGLFMVYAEFLTRLGRCLKVCVSDHSVPLVNVI